MSHEKAGIVRRAKDAWNRRDIDWMLTLSGLEVECVNAGFLEPAGERRQ